MKIADFKERLRLVSQRRDDTPLFTIDEHAPLCIDKLFELAHGEVDILTPDLSPRIFGDEIVLRAVKHFLCQQKESRVLVAHILPISEHHPWAEEFRTSDQVQLVHLPENYGRMLNYSFVVNDAGGYLYKHRWRDDSSAIAAFADKRGGDNLRVNVFQKIWGTFRCSQYVLPFPSFESRGGEIKAL